VSLRPDVVRATNARVGVVEIGSRAIRSMVIDLSGDRLNVVDAKNIPHTLSTDSISEDGGNALNLLVSALRDHIASFDCVEICIYGTELCRRIGAINASWLPSYLIVLSPAEEARASWAAGLMCVTDLRPARYTIIDQGAESIEFADGYWDRAGVKEFTALSLPLGHNRLTSLFRDNSSNPQVYGRKIQEQLNEWKSDISLFSNKGGALIVLGSVATKLGWLNVRRPGDDNYNARLVNGSSLRLNDLMRRFSELLTMYAKDKEQARCFVDARTQSRDDAEIVIAGSLLFALLFKRLDVTSARVSGYGTRHGVAKLISLGIGPKAT
jgi:exopolyphosphatase/pppGpp-phosphohydrolase